MLSLTWWIDICSVCNGHTFLSNFLADLDLFFKFLGDVIYYVSSLSSLLWSSIIGGARRRERSHSQVIDLR